MKSYIQKGQAERGDAHPLYREPRVHSEFWASQSNKASPCLKGCVCALGMTYNCRIQLEAGGSQIQNQPVLQRRILKSKTKRCKPQEWRDISYRNSRLKEWSPHGNVQSWKRARESLQAFQREGPGVNELALHIRLGVTVHFYKPQEDRSRLCKVSLGHTTHAGKHCTHRFVSILTSPCPLPFEVLLYSQLLHLPPTSPPPMYWMLLH